MPPSDAHKAAIWIRVSTDEQDTAAQRRELVAWAEREGWPIVETYDVTASAFRGRHNPAIATVIADARGRRFDLLLVWALDRLSRQGALATLQTVDRLRQQGVRVVSLQDPFTQLIDTDLADVFTAFAGWVAKFESDRRSERTKAGIEARRAAGQPIGRPAGSKDSRPRQTSGYRARYRAGQS